MKKKIHPKYQKVVFKDLASDFQILCGSTVETDKKIKWTDGKEYPLVEIEISSGSHPFFTGKEKIMDTAGRVEKFEAKRKAAMKKMEDLKKIQSERKKREEKHKKSVEEIFKPKKKEEKKEEKGQSGKGTEGQTDEKEVVAIEEKPIVEEKNEKVTEVEEKEVKKGTNEKVEDIVEEVKEEKKEKVAETNEEEVKN